MLVSNHLTTKTFQYSKGAVTIKISLRNDIKQELKDGLEILEAIVKDIKEELK